MKQSAQPIVGVNLPVMPKAPILGWSSEERCRHYLDMINATMNPKKPWTVEELRIAAFEWGKWELLLLILLWQVEGCSGGYVREHARMATSTLDTLALQRLVEHIEHFNERPKVNE